MAHAAGVTIPTTFPIETMIIGAPICYYLLSVFLNMGFLKQRLLEFVSYVFENVLEI